MSLFGFGNIVVVDKNQIGVVVKIWADNTYDVYVRNYNRVKDYNASEIRHFIYSKELSEEEIDFYD